MHHEVNYSVIISFSKKNKRINNKVGILDYDDCF